MTLVEPVIKFYKTKNIKKYYFNNYYYILNQQVVEDWGKKGKRAGEESKWYPSVMLTLAFVSGSLATDDLCHM
jgi:predicted DNA-binding WGR domain protein